MMMNSILGIESAGAGKPSAFNARAQEKSNGSSDFSAFVAAEGQRSQIPENVSEAVGDPAAPEAESVQAAASSESKGKDAGEGAGSEMTAAAEQLEPLPETEPEVLRVASADAGAAIGAEIGVAKEARLESGADPAAAGDGLDMESVPQVNKTEAESSRRPEAGEALRLAAETDGEVPDATGNTAPGHRESAAASSGRQDSQGTVTAALQRGAEASVAGRAAAESVSRVKHARPEQPSASAEGKADTGAAAQEVIEPAVPDAGRSRPVQLDSAAKPAPPFSTTASASAGAGQVSDGSSQVRPLSEFPNVQAVEKLAAVQPEGVTRAVAAGAQGAVQALAAGQPAPLKANQTAVPYPSGAKMFDDVPEVSAEVAKAASPDVRTATAQIVSAPQQASAAASVSQSWQTGGMNVALAEPDALSHALGMTGESPGLTQLLAEATFGTPAGHRPEMPRMIAAQIAEAFAAKGEQKVEVSLNPQELGQVKMRVVTSETGITMIIQTERPETGDLMRRHINELAEEFRRMGYENISFEFSGGQTGGGQSGENEQGSSAQADGMSETQTSGGNTAATPATQNLRLGSAGVDMRV